VTDLAIEHIDDTGAPCPRHPAASAASLFQLAMVGSRAPAFHHDCASKLQGLLMALDEMSELTEHGDPQLLRALEVAVEASRELNALLNVNRALTKPAVRGPIAVRTLVGQAADRVGVRLQGALPDAVVGVAAPSVTHAVALALDVAAGAGRGRSLPIAAALVDRDVELTLTAQLPAPSNASESLAIATYVLVRDGGALWCAEGGAQLVVRLPGSVEPAELRAVR
jgi:hypothetical protein